jgi:RNA recognition motif-containing protein
MSPKETKKPNVATKKRTLEKVVEPKKKIQKVSNEEVVKPKKVPVEESEEIIKPKMNSKKAQPKVSIEESSEESEEIVPKKKVTKKVPLKVSSEEESEEEEEEKVVKAKKVNQVPVEDRTLYFSNIPLEFTQKEILNILKNYGTIEEIRFRWSDKPKRIHNGSAFIQFESKKFSDAAVKDLDKKLVGDKNLIVNYNENYIRNSNQSIQDADAVVVYNLSTETVEKTIQSHFNHCGVIREVFIPKYDGNSSGKAFVNFVVKKDMSKIIEEALKMTGTKIEGHEIRVISRVKKLIEPPKKFKQNKF